jgi:hypothetical protein
MTVFVLAVWLVGAAVTKHSLEEMALLGRGPWCPRPEKRIAPAKTARARVGYDGPNRRDTARGGQGIDAIEHVVRLAARPGLHHSVTRCLGVRFTAPFVPRV